MGFRGVGGTPSPASARQPCHLTSAARTPMSAVWSIGSRLCGADGRAALAGRGRLLATRPPACPHPALCGMPWGCEPALFITAPCGLQHQPPPLPQLLVRGRPATTAQGRASPRGLAHEPAPPARTPQGAHLRPCFVWPPLSVWRWAPRVGGAVRQSLAACCVLLMVCLLRVVPPFLSCSAEGLARPRRSLACAKPGGGV